MSGFIAVPEQPPGQIQNDGFFPDMDVAKVRAAMRLDGTVTNDILRDALLGAVLEVNDALSGWKAIQVDLGHAHLADVSFVQIGGEPRLVILYRRAVGSCAAAALVERYRGYDASSSDAGKKAEDKRPLIDELRRDLRWAICDIQGTPRCTIGLI